MAPKHRDPKATATNKSSSAAARACTPERSEEAAVHGAASAPAPAPFAPPPSLHKDLSRHALMARLKAVAADIVQAASTGLLDIDDFLQVADEASRDLRNVKLQARSVRKAPASWPSLNKTTTPAKEERERHLPITLNTPPPPPEAELRELDKNDGSVSAAPRDAPPQQAKQPRSYASILQGKTSPKKARAAPPSTSATPATIAADSAPAAAAARDDTDADPSAANPAATAARAAAPAAARSPSAKMEELEARAALEGPFTVEERASSALRSEERRREADSRRQTILAEKKSRQGVQAERLQLAKERRETHIEKVRVETEEKVARATKRNTEAVQKTKDTAARVSQRVDEVQFVNSLAQTNLALRVEQRMAEAEQTQEALAAEKQRRDREKAEAHHAVVERGRELAEEKLEKTKAREAQREQAVKRAEEARRAEAERKAQRKEERERHVKTRQEERESEAEARSRREAERLAASEQLREEHRTQLKARADRHEEKVKGARERKEKEEPRHPTFHEVLPQMASTDEDKVAARLAKAQSTAQRTARVFREQYQKECTIPGKELNKSKLRAILARLGASCGNSTGSNAAAGSAPGAAESSATNLTQARPALHELLAATRELSPLDEEHVRYFDAFEPILKVFAEARRTHDAATLRLASIALHRLLLGGAKATDADAAASIHYFIRAGHLLPLLSMIHEEIRTLRKHNHSQPLTLCFSVLQLCLNQLCSGDAAAASGASSAVSTPQQQAQRGAALREQTMELLEVAGVDAFCLAVAATCVDEEDMPCLHLALTVLSYQVDAATRRPSQKDQWLRRCVESMLTLAQNLLTPNGTLVTERLSNLATAVLFAALRILNASTRLAFSQMHELVASGTSEGDAAAGLQVFHVVSSFLKYVAVHDEDLERIPADSAAVPADAAPSPSLVEALQSGVTHRTIPRIGVDGDASSGGSWAAGAAAALGSNATPAGSFASSRDAIAAASGHLTPSSMLRAALHELLLFVGYIAMGDERVQSVFGWGKERPLLSQLLAALPVQYFSSLRHVLFPTLVCLAFEHDANREIMGREMDVASLAGFLREEIDALPPRHRQYLTRVPDSVAAAEQQTADEQKHDDGAGGSKAAGAGAQQRPRNTKSPKKSWADMMDDDDDMTFLANAPALASETALASAAAAAAKSKEAAASAKRENKDTLIKTVVNASRVRHYAAHFQLRRRFPIFKWNEAVSYFETGGAK